MPKPAKPGYYAVHRGRAPGVYSTWEECERQVKHCNGAIYKKLTSLEAAQEFVANGPTKPHTAGSSTSSTVVPSSAQPNGGAVHSTCSAAPTLNAMASSSKLPEVATPVLSDTTEAEDIVYTDGSCHGNGAPGSVAGIGVWWADNHERNLSERCPGKQTNNRAELIAVVRALQDTPMSTRPLIIRTDSQYTINCVQKWIRNWERNGWRTANGQPVENSAVIKYLVALLRGRIAFGHPVRLDYIKGHAGHRGNEAADRLANLGASMPPMEERDWQTLQREFEDLMERRLQARNAAANNAPSQTSINRPLSEEELKAYASCLLSDEEMTAYADCLLDDDDLAKELAEA